MTTTLEAPAPALLERRRFTLDEWDAMIAAGAFDSDERQELIEGEIASMSPIGDDHSRAERVLQRLFARLAVEKRAEAIFKQPLRLPGHSAPQPDLALLRYCEQLGDRVQPLAGEVFLVVEVSDSTLARDVQVKAPLYARAGIPEYWVVDIVNRGIHVHREPWDGAYLARTSHGAWEAISPLGFPDVVLDVATLFRSDGKREA